jgi:hypothetical protein
MEGNAIRFTPSNYGENREFGISLNQNERLFKDIWQINNTLSYAYNKIEGNIEGLSLNQSGHSISIYLNNTILLSQKKGWSTNVSFFYRSPYLDGDTKFLSGNSLNFSIAKQFEDINIRIWANDVYSGYMSRAKIVREDLDAYIFHDFGSRQVGISLTCNFGNRKVSGGRNRGTSNDEIKNRAR